MKILLVEDNERVAQFVVKGLQEAGHTTDHAANGRDGMFLAASEPYDVIIMDRMLPGGIDGLAIIEVLRKAGIGLSEVGVFEVNEAFAPVPLAWLAETGADPALLNPLGGAIALGHPLGMSGARLVVSLLHELRRRGGRYGLATLCVGVGQGQAALFERVTVSN